MISYYGDFAEDDTVLIPFNTFDSNDPSASVTITNLANADIKVHKDGGLTQIVTDGATVVINFDGITGNHLVTIDTSAHADYSTGSEYAVRIEGTTVDGATINAWIGAFSIERAGAVLALLKATTLASIKAETALIVADTSELQTDDVPGLIATLDTVVDTVKAETALIVADTNELQTDDIPGLLATIAGYLDTEIAAILADTNELQTDWADGGRLDVILDAAGGAGDPWITALPGAYGPGTAGEILGDWKNGERLDLLLDAIPTTAMRGTDDAALATALATAQTDLDTITGSDGVTLATAQALYAPAKAGDSMDLVANAVDSTSVATGALTAAKFAAGAIDAAALATDAVAEIADGVWDEVLTGATHNIAASAGRRLRNLGSTALLDGTASAGSLTSITLTGGSATDGLYIGCGVNIGAGTGAGQSRYIVSYDGGTKIAEVARNWITAPSSDSEFVVTADHQIDFIEMGLAQAGGAAAITLATSASSDDDLLTGTAIRIMAGAGDGQVRIITAYNGTTKVATVSPAWEVQPDATSSYATLNTGPANVIAVANTAQTAGDLADLLTTIDTVVDAIVADTNELQTDDIPTLIAALPTAVENRTEMDSNSTQLTLIVADTNELQNDWTNAGRLDALLDGIKVVTDAQATDGSGLSAIPWNASWDAEVESEVNDALDTAISELVGVPSATPTIRQALMLPFMAIRNQRDTTAAADEIHNSAGGVILTATISDDTVTFAKSKYA